MVEDLPALVATPTELSFPSAHSSTSFAAARAYGRWCPPAPLYAAAAAMAASRVYLGVHYPSDVAGGRAARAGHGERGAMKVGIVGMPNAGKSSLFNALTRAGAEAANYPFTTIEPNVAVVPVVDERLDAWRRRSAPRTSCTTPIDFHDIAGLVRGASEGEGLGNKFLANIREVDAIVHVVRAHHDANVIHPEGEVDPRRDIDTIETELLYADLEQAERRLDRVTKQARGGDKQAQAEERWVTEVVAALQAGRPARTVPVPADAPDALRNLHPLTAKPVLLRGQRRRGRRRRCRPRWPSTPRRSARWPSRSPRASRPSCPSSTTRTPSAMRADMGVGESGLRRVVDGAFALLHQIAFFTAGEDKPAQSWHMRDGLTAWHAAGEIHSDIQKGFVRAEVIGWDALVDAGGYAGARERGVLRLEGRDYVMRDGDVITVKFTP